MSLRSRRFLRLVLPVIAVTCLSAASQQQLNPTVKVLPGATSPVPPECEEGLAPQPMQRVMPEEKIVARQIVAPPDLQVPPSKELRATLFDVQTAAEGNDRASFVDALARVKPLLAAYPTGGERTAAENAVAVFGELDRVWDYQLTPAGTFFDASSDLFKMLSQVPGYDTFIRRQILVDQNGVKFYPSSESRVFLTQVAATRLKDLGIRTTTTAPKQATPVPAATAAQTERPATAKVKRLEKRSEPAVSQEQKSRTTTAAPRRQEAKAAVASSKTRTPAKRKPVKAAAGVPELRQATVPAPTKKAVSAATTTATAAPLTRESEAPSSPTPAATATLAPVVSTSVPPTTQAATSTAATSTDTASTASNAAVASSTTTDTTATLAPSTDTSSTEPSATSGESAQTGKPNEPRNLLWPIILIVIGVGVLILLFRTSPGGK